MHGYDILVWVGIGVGGFVGQYCTLLGFRGYFYVYRAFGVTL